MSSAMRAILACILSGSMIGASLFGLGLAHSRADTEHDYLSLVKRVAITALPDDATLLKLGHGVCNFLSKDEWHNFDGVSGAADGVMEYLDGTNKDRAYDSGVIVFAAAHALCPENLALVERWRDS